MDNPSHFYSRSSSQPSLDASFDFSEISSSELNASSSFAFDRDQSLSQSALNGYPEYQQLDGESNWKSETVECKQEIDPTSFMNNTITSDNSNYASECDFNEPYQYAYDPMTPSYANNVNSSAPSAHKSKVQQHRMGPYHISSSTKNQLPSWYNPPNTYYTQPQQPSFFQQQYPYHHHGSFVAAQPPPVEQSMRHMMNLTSRYSPPEFFRSAPHLETDHSKFD